MRQHINSNCDQSSSMIAKIGRLSYIRISIEVVSRDGICDHCQQVYKS